VSTSVIEPGTRLAGRYRLEERVSRSGGSTLWRATDEILARAVAVRTFDPDFPLIIEVVMAARSASRLTDPRLTQVFDADNSGEFAYVVSEWVVGTTLEDMIFTGGPMEPGRAATLLGEAAEAIAAAHVAGLAHLRLTPRDLLWTTGNTVKILGLGVDAALYGTKVASPALADTEGLAHMLYLALTAHWPGTAPCSLPAAPTSDGTPCPPQQLRPSVPPALDRIVRRALGRAGQDAPLTSPAKLAEALSGVPRVPLPLFAGYPQGPPPSVVPRPEPASPERTRALPMPPVPQGSAHHQPAPARSRPEPPYRTDPERPGPGSADPSGTGPGGSGRAHGDGTRTRGLGTRGIDRGSGRRRTLIGAAIGLAALVIGIVGWQLAENAGGTHEAGGPSASAPAPAPKKTEVKLAVQDVSGLDEPNPAEPGHNDTSVGKNASAVIDGRTSTVWDSEGYKSADFGNYLKGLGIRLDMGSSVKVTRVKVVLPGRGGGTLELRVGDGQTPGSLHVADKQSDATGTVDLHNSKAMAGRYVLVWFTTPVPQGFKAQISEVTVYGQAS
jgi:hypothetical protein